MINLQVRFTAAHNEVYILRVERENLFTFDRIVRCEQKHMISEILHTERS